MFKKFLVAASMLVGSTFMVNAASPSVETLYDKNSWVVTVNDKSCMVGSIQNDNLFTFQVFADKGLVINWKTPDMVITADETYGFAPNTFIGFEGSTEIITASSFIWEYEGANVISANIPMGVSARFFTDAMMTSKSVVFSYTNTNGEYYLVIDLGADFTEAMQAYIACESTFDS